MAGGKHMEKDQLERYLGRRLAEQEKVWGITSPAVDANDRLISLIQTANEKTGKQVVVLIDEYEQRYGWSHADASGLSGHGSVLQQC